MGRPLSTWRVSGAAQRPPSSSWNEGPLSRPSMTGGDWHAQPPSTGSSACCACLPGFLFPCLFRHIRFGEICGGVAEVRKEEHGERERGGGQGRRRRRRGGRRVKGEGVRRQEVESGKGKQEAAGGLSGAVIPALRGPAPDSLSPFPPVQVRRVSLGSDGRQRRGPGGPEAPRCSVCRAAEGGPLPSPQGRPEGPEGGLRLASRQPPLGPCGEGRRLEARHRRIPPLGHREGRRPRGGAPPPGGSWVLRAEQSPPGAEGSPLARQPPPGGIGRGRPFRGRTGRPRVIIAPPGAEPLQGVPRV